MEKAANTISLPLRKFDSIGEEYDDKQAQYNAFRLANKKKDEDAIKAELDALKNKNEQLKRI